VIDRTVGPHEVQFTPTLSDLAQEIVTRVEWHQSPLPTEFISVGRGDCALCHSPAGVVRKPASIEARSKGEGSGWMGAVTLLETTTKPGGWHCLPLLGQAVRAADNSRYDGLKVLALNCTASQGGSSGTKPENQAATSLRAIALRRSRWKLCSIDLHATIDNSSVSLGCLVGPPVFLS
jgi:hypothetical protein